MNDLTRGELAKQSGVNRETIRYYERNNLPPISENTLGQYSNAFIHYSLDVSYRRLHH